jgi:hypothetical protein
VTRQAEAVPDTVRWFLFQLQHPGWHFRTPLNDPGGDGRWHATNGTIALTAGTLAALLDQLDWIRAT